MIAIEIVAWPLIGSMIALIAALILASDLGSWERRRDSKGRIYMLLHPTFGTTIEQTP